MTRKLIWLIASLALALASLWGWLKIMNYLSDIRLLDFKSGPEYGLMVFYIMQVILVLFVVICVPIYYFILVKTQNYHIKRLIYLILNFIASVLIIVPFFWPIRFSQPIPTKYWFRQPQTFEECQEAGGFLTYDKKLVNGSVIYIEYCEGFKSTFSREANLVEGQ